MCFSRQRRVAQPSFHLEARQYRYEEEGCSAHCPRKPRAEGLRAEFPKLAGEQRPGRVLDRDASKDPPASQGNPALPFLYYRYKPSCLPENAQIQPARGGSRHIMGLGFMDCVASCITGCCWSLGTRRKATIYASRTLPGIMLGLLDLVCETT